MSKNRMLSLVGASMVIAAGFWPSRAEAQAPAPIPTEHCAPSPFVHDDDPFWGAGPYPYSAASLNGECLSARVRVLATPIEANVYVDGFYAGVVDDFDGVLQQLPISPGDHAITLFLEGYRTVTKHVVAMADSSSELRLTMDELGPDGVSEPPPARCYRVITP